MIIDPVVCRGRAVADIADAACKGGATIIQLRNKHDDILCVKEQALSIQKVLEGSDVPFIINDYVDLVKELDLDGVHIGQEDGSPEDARRIIGGDKVLGLTAFSKAHYDAIDPSNVDYVGTGPFYATKTKPNKAVLGLQGFTDLMKYAPVPVVGIGGITPTNSAAVIEAGAQGVAMMRAVSEADDPTAATRLFVDVVQGVSND